MMEVPQLHGFGPAANRLLEAYNKLLKVSFCQLFCFYDADLFMFFAASAFDMFFFF